MRLWIQKTFEKNGEPDAAKLTAFISFIICIILACIDQLTVHKINETVFLTFAAIATAGLGISAIKR
jgi:hypothetical protein